MGTDTSMNKWVVSVLIQDTYVRHDYFSANTDGTYLNFAEAA